MSILRPSPAITVSEHTSIGETIRTLIEHKVGSVLITSYSAPHKPIGIFTERDLLRFALDLKNGNQWDVAIGTVMTKKLITLSITDLDHANQIMLDNNIRHLPIIYEDDLNETHLAGVISMRDAFRALVDENKTLSKKIGESNGHQQISVLAKNTRDQQLQNKILSAHASLKVINADFDQTAPHEALKSVMQTGIFIFDIDQFSVQFWPIFLKTILDQASHPDVFLIYNPVMHDKKNIQAIKTIAAGKAVHAYSKPLSILQYLADIQGSLVNH